ncbi:ribosomal RNA-processing protein 7-domain-containing protein [Cryomyces antarcticus]
MAPKVPLKVADYTVLPLAVPPLPTYPKQTIHYLYLRQHNPKVADADTPRSLFLVNVPIDTTEAHIRSLFADQLGGARVEYAEFEGARSSRKTTAPVAPSVPAKGRKRKRGQDGVGEDEEDVAKLPETWDRELRRSGSTAVVVFVDRASAEMALKEARRAAKGGKEVVWGKGVEGKVPALGSARYLQHHTLRYADKLALQRSIDAYMTRFAASEASRSRALARQRQVPDEDGFITVTRGGRTGPARLEEAQQKAEEQKEKQKGKEDFYRFQTREKKKERAGELVRAFEQDRRKVEEMRRKRGRFKPM